MHIPQSSFGALAPVGLPSDVKFCKNCVISNQRPITQIESKHKINHRKLTTRFTDGICDACRWAEQKELINWEEREEHLIDLCNKYRSNDGSFDVVVPASGGKDSRYVAHLLKHKYHMTPLTVTWKPHIYTDVGFQNLVSMIDNGFSNILISPNGKVQRNLCRLAFKNLGHPFQPFIIGQRVVGPKAALAHDIKLVMYGENVAEYGNNIEDNYLPVMDSKLYTCFDFSHETLGNFLIAGIPLSELISDYNFTFSDLLPYQSPSLPKVIESEIEVHYMSYYRKWVPQENYYYAVEHTDFMLNPQRRDGSFSRYAGLDDVMEDLHYYMQIIKFGMGRCTWDAAQEVRTGRLERDEAIRLVQKYDQEVPQQFMDEILKYLGLSLQEFESIINSFRSPHLWDYSPESGFSLKHLVD